MIRREKSRREKKIDLIKSNFIETIKRLKKEGEEIGTPQEYVNECYEHNMLNLATCGLKNEVIIDAAFLYTDHIINIALKDFLDKALPIYLNKIKYITSLPTKTVESTKKSTERSIGDIFRGLKMESNNNGNYKNNPSMLELSTFSKY